jgi:citrate lyase subunit beta/citryl-CoA lyase
VRELEWGHKPPAYRVNGLATPFFYRDVVDVVEAVGDALRLIVIPKVDRPENLIAVDTLLSGIERRQGFEVGAIKLAAQIESALGLVNVERIATATDRLHSLDFGPGDFAASLRMPLAAIGAADEWDARYPGHRFHYAMARIVVAARAAGVLAIDGPSANFKDLDAFRQSCLIARVLGYDGKWCIHPSQIPIANEAFTPTEAEISWARRVVDAYEQALAEGSGVITVDNTMVDAASVKMASALLEVARRVDSS